LPLKISLPACLLPTDGEAGFPISNQKKPPKRHLQFNKKHDTSPVKFYRDNFKLSHISSGIANAAQHGAKPFHFSNLTPVPSSPDSYRDGEG
jgi:hypothetical protein